MLAYIWSLVGAFFSAPRGEALLAHAVSSFEKTIAHLEQVVEDIQDDVDDSQDRETEYRSWADAEAQEQERLWSQHDKAKRFHGKLTELLS